MKYKEIVVILLSSHLSQANANAHLASQIGKSPANIFIIEFLNTAIGLGLLVQAAAEFAHRGYTGVEINRLIRGMINHIYFSLLFTRSIILVPLRSDRSCPGNCRRNARCDPILYLGKW